MSHQHPPLPSVQKANDPVDNEATSHHHSLLDHSEEYERLNHSQLKELCKDQGFACGGNRDALIQRLRGHDTRLANPHTQQPRGLPPSATGDGPTRARDGLNAISDTALLVGGAIVCVALLGQTAWLLLKDHVSYETVITILEWRRTLFWWAPLVVGVTLGVGKFFLFPSRFGIFKFSPLYLLISFLNTTVVLCVANPPSPGEEFDPTSTLSPPDPGETLPASIPRPPSPAGNGDGNETEIRPLDTRWIDTELCRGLDTLKDHAGWQIPRERQDSPTSLLPPSLPPTPGLFTPIPKRFLICKALSEASLKVQAVQDRDLYSDSCQSLSQEVSGLKSKETEVQGLHRQNEALGGMVRRATRDLFLARGNVWTLVRFRDRTDADEGTSLAYGTKVTARGMQLRICPHQDTAPLDTLPSKQFTFDCVLHPPISTRAAFETVEPLTQATLEGFNLCIIADGQSGSGKSYTMMNGPDPIAPSAVTSLFTELHAGRHCNHKVLVTCSILEIYKDQARDLITNTEIAVPVTSAVPFGYSRRPLGTANNLDPLMREACAQRTDRPTSQNQHSSRGDLVIIITITKHDLLDRRQDVSHLVFVDLAGSESLLSSSCEHVEEAKMIKKGRESLQRMMTAYRESKPLYAESELTRLLRRYIDDPETPSKMVLLATASPLQKDCKATLATLEFAGQIRNGVEKPPAKRRHPPT